MQTTTFTTTLAQLLTVTDKANLEQALMLLKQHSFTATSDYQFTDILKQTPLATVELIQPFISSAMSTTLVTDYLQFVSTLPVAQLSLSYEPTQKQVRALSKLIREKLDNTLVLDIKYDPALGLGFSLDFAGNTYSGEIEIKTV